MHSKDEVNKLVDWTATPAPTHTHTHIHTSILSILLTHVNLKIFGLIIFQPNPNERKLCLHRLKNWIGLGTGWRV